MRPKISLGAWLDNVISEDSVKGDSHEKNLIALFLVFTIIISDNKIINATEVGADFLEKVYMQISSDQESNIITTVNNSPRIQSILLLIS